MKTCSKCLLLKTITSFYTAPNKDGLEGQCKDCKSTYIKDKWSKDPLYKALHSKYYIKSLKFSEQERQHVCVTCSYLIKTTTAPNITGNCRQCARKIASQKWTQNNLSLKAAHRAKRRAIKLKATPGWLSSKQLSEIQELYVLAKELQWLSDSSDPLEVDHIVPLQGKTVSGLHVPWNLQILPKSLNCSKGNR